MKKGQPQAARDAPASFLQPRGPLQPRGSVALVTKPARVAALSTVPEQDVAMPEQERASGQPQAAASSGSQGQTQAAASSGSQGQPQAAASSGSQGQPQAARGFPERTRVYDPKRGGMISVKRNDPHEPWSPCDSSVASDEPEEVTEAEPEEVTEAEEEQGTEEEQWTEEEPLWTEVQGPTLYKNRAGFLVNEKKTKNK